MEFTRKLMRNRHTAMLEFGTVYLKVPVEVWRQDEHEWEYMFPEDLPWIQRNCDGQFHYITTNFRHILNGWVGFKAMEAYWSEPEEPHIKRYTALFTISIGTAREFTRHRAFSFAQESTRYCNYSKDKFQNSVTFIIPSWSNDIVPTTEYDLDDYFGKEATFIQGLHWAEENYLDMIAEGASAQEAREVLPLATKSELCMCGFEEDWSHFFDLRMRGITGAPHPDAQFIADKLWEQFKKKGINL